MICETISNAELQNGFSQVFGCGISCRQIFGLLWLVVGRGGWWWLVVARGSLYVVLDLTKFYSRPSRNFSQAINVEDLSIVRYPLQLIYMRMFSTKFC